MVKDSKLAGSFLGQFWPVNVLWEGDSALFPSEQSARWALRDMKGRLAEAGALAYHRGRLHVDPQMVAQLARELAVEKARKRYA